MNLEKLFMNLLEPFAKFFMNLESFPKLFSERANGHVCAIPTYVTNDVVPKT